METTEETRPLAAPEYEQHAHELFPVSTSPEEYVARFGSGWGCCSFPSHSYRDKELDAWLQEFGRLMRIPGIIGTLREKYLTPEEIEKERRLDETRWD